MGRPSDPMLAWLRKLVDTKGLNTARLAEKCGLPRARVRKVLTGAEPMLVDEFVRLANALEIAPTDLGLPDAAAVEAAAETPPAPTAPAVPNVDPWGNHPEQLLRVGFTLGCDFFFLTDTEQLEGSGIPRHVLAEHRGRALTIRLDAAFHSYNDPRYDEAGVTIALSFDAVYDCRFPWPSIQQVIFFPARWEPAARSDAEPASPPTRPRLRLVE